MCFAQTLSTLVNTQICLENELFEVLSYIFLALEKNGGFPAHYFGLPVGMSRFRKEIACFVFFHEILVGS